MTHRTRRIIFYILLAAFFIFGAVAVFYAEGWRVDIATLRVKKVGGIFVRSFPRDAALFLDGKPVANGSGFLSQGTLIDDLFPGTYDLALSAEGYKDWHETLDVQPALVAENRFAVLVPATSTRIAATDAVQSAFPENNDVVFETAHNAIVWNNQIIGTGTLLGATPQYALIQSSDGAYRTVDLTNGMTTNISILLGSAGINSRAVTHIFIDPQNSAMVIAATKMALYAINLANQKILTIEKASAGSTIEPIAATSPSRIAWVESDASAPGSATTTIRIYDRGTQMITDSMIFAEGTISSIAWIKDGTLGFVKNDQNQSALFTYDTDSKMTAKIADDVKDFYPSDDGNMVAALEHRSVEVIGIPQDSNGNNYYRFNPPNIENVERLLWFHDKNHLFIQYPDRVAFLDLADSGLRNLEEVGKIASGSVIQYDGQENIVYIIDPSRNLLGFDFAR